MAKRLDADGITRGLHSVSYDRDEYRCTVREGGRSVFESVYVLPMREAIHESTALAAAFKSNCFYQGA